MSVSRDQVKADINRVLNTIQRYLMQQKDLFGNDLIIEANRSVRSADQETARTEDAWSLAKSLEDLNSQICSCLECPLGQTRKNFVFGVGNPRADVMFVGEAPGADEDAQGEPFVGKAGQLLNKIIGAVGLTREEVYICNILKCRPPNNRDPQTTEMETCTPYLNKQIELVKPKFIICLGRIAAQWLLQTNSSLTMLRKETYDFQGAKLIVTYHPAALLRNPNWKPPTWEDMQKFRAMYDAMKSDATK